MADHKVKGLDDTFYETLLKVAQEAVDRGVSLDEISRLTAETLGAVVDKTAPGVADSLEKQAPPMLRQRRRFNRGFRRRLRKIWGPALDLTYTIIVCAEEIGATFAARHQPDASDMVYQALIGLHARACRVAMEVLELLSAGYPLGALARSRTLHEIAVTAMVIGNYSRQPAQADLAERFILHSHVQAWGDARVYQEHHEALGEDSFDESELAEMKQTYDELLARYGRDFKEPYGWALGLPLDNLRQFDKLEKLAEVSHLRGYYRWASHEVHSDAKGWAQNATERGGVTYLGTGPTNAGLGDPGQLALISLQQVTVALLIDGVDPEADVCPERLISMKALQQMVSDAEEAYAHGHTQVGQAEERHEARETRSGYRGRVARRWVNLRWHLTNWP